MRLINTAKTIRQECGNFIRDLFTRETVSPNARESEILHAIKTRGFCVIEEFYSAQECASMRDDIDRLIIKYRAQLFIDKENSDHRIFGANRLSDTIGGFYEYPLINKIVKAHEKTSNISGFTLAARLEYKPDNKGSGAGWHRDWAVNKQIKAMLYLSDVGNESGPFQYLEESQKHLNIIKDCYTENFNFNQNRFTDAQIEKLTQKKYSMKWRTLTGKAGTLILVNTRGIHRGMPIEQGVRYALTNYYWSNMPIPEHMEKLMIGK